MNGAARWMSPLGIALIVSLALNLLLAGWLIGRFVHERHWRPSFAGMPARPGDRMMEWMMGRDLDEASRQAVREAMGGAHAAMDQARAATREARLVAREALRAEPFDRARAEAAFAQSRERQMEAMRRIHAALIDGAEKLPAEARTKLMSGRDGRESRERR